MMFAQIFSDSQSSENGFGKVLLFLGLSLLLYAITPDMKAVQASSECGTCPEGKICVQVGEVYECQCPTE